MIRILKLVLLSLSAFVGRAENSLASFDDETRTFLMQGVGFTNNDLQKVEKGGVASRSLPTEDGREVATAGFVRVSITPEEFARRLTDIASTHGPAAPPRPTRMRTRAPRLAIGPAWRATSRAPTTATPARAWSASPITSNSWHRRPAEGGDR